MDKKLIDVYVIGYNIYDLEGSVKDLVERLNIDIEDYGDDCFFDTDGGDRLHLYRKRLETNKEYDKRIKKEARATKMDIYKKAQKEIRELKEYERLKKKFE